MKQGLIDALKSEMSNFTFPIIINNLPSIDGLLCSQRQVIWGMDKAHMNSNGQFYKMLKATGRIFDYYVLGDSGLTGVMKNMGNNYSLNKMLLPKGNFGNKNKREGDGAAPRYIECKLSPYSECLLEGINKNSVPLKLNYDATEKEPVVLPSKIPNILTNMHISIAVSEANNMPSHNMNDTCNSIISYIKTKDIDKSIELLKCPDLPSGGEIIYNRNTFESIYKTGKGSFINVGKYKYNEKKNMIIIYEIPYTTYIENIADEIKSNLSKFQNEVIKIHNGSDKDGLSLEIYLKKNADINIVIGKLRKYTSFEKTFPCNFTILDLDGKTPKLMSLEDIIRRWIQHRQKCIINEYNYDINKQSSILNKYNGLKLINNDIDKAISIIRNSKNEEYAISELISTFGLNKDQAEYVKSIKLININKDWIKKKISEISNIEQSIKEMELKTNNIDDINNEIIQQLEDVKKKFEKPRLTEIIYEDKLENINIDDIKIEQYNCRVFYTNKYIKKHLKQSDNHKIVEGNTILGDFTTTNKSTLLIFTNKERRYRIQCSDLEQYQPSAFGTFAPKLLGFEDDEEIIKIVSVEKPTGFILVAYEDGNLAKIKIDKYMSSYKKLEKCYSNKSKVLDIYYSEKDVDVLMVSDEGKGIIFNSSNFNAVGSTNSQGNCGMKLIEENKVVSAIIDINKDLNFELETLKGKNKSFMLSDIAPTNKSNEERNLYTYLLSRRGNQGNFLINTRTNEDKVLKLIRK